jgi:uncharacterized protein (TIGR03083 family)
MTRLTADGYLAHLRHESARFRQVMGATPAEAGVPACPDWTADDLLWHLAEVQWFWGTVINGRPAGPPSEHPTRPGGRDALLDFFDDASSTLIAALATADPAEAAWSWADEQTVGFTYRRQAHEALIHRLDAEQAGGDVTPLPSDLAADGVAELMEVMFGGEPPAWASFTPSGSHTVIELTDTGERIRVATGLFEGTEPESGKNHDGPHLLVVDDGPADAVVSGTAADLNAWLWRRRDETGIAVDGDQGAYAEWRAAVDQPID